MVGTNCGGPLWGGANAPHPYPFEQYAPKQNQLRLLAVRLGLNNLAEIAWDMVQASELAVYVPAERNSVQCGEKRFDLGEWIIREPDGNYRHPTEAEVTMYGLSEVLGGMV